MAMATFWIVMKVLWFMWITLAQASTLVGVFIVMNRLERLSDELVLQDLRKHGPRG